MRRHALTIILTTALVLPPALASTTVYRWVDDQGVVHFSDQPHQGAQKMHVEDAPTFPAPPVPRASGPSTTQSQNAAPQASCSIASPTDQQMFMNAYSVSGNIQMPPSVEPGDRVVLMLDGKVLTGAADLSGAFHIDQIDRGAHTIAAQVQAPDGQVICQTPPVTFFVHQPSVQNPQSPVRPH